MSEVKLNKTQTFNNSQFGTLEVVLIDGKEYFPATDCARMLGYSNPQEPIRKYCRADGCVNRSVIDSMGRTQQKKYITEGNLYRLITHSKLPAAEQFEVWVFDEVLPSIRKHGMYATEELIANPDLAIAAFTALKEEREKVKMLAAEVDEMKPKANYCDVVLNCKSLIKVTTIAKDYGQSARWLNEKLHDLGVQFRQGELWVLYQKYAEKGYACTKTHIFINDDGTTHSKSHTYWTQKGRQFIYDLLKTHGILPVTEQKLLVQADSEH